MPYPYVHYPSRFTGAFLGFQESEGKRNPLYFCSCQRKGIEIYLKHYGDGESGKSKSDLPKALRGLDFVTFNFKDNLCHICNQVCPAYGFGKIIDSTKFSSIYGYYIQAQAYEYGIGFLGKILEPKLLPSDIVPYLITRYFDHSMLDEISYKDFIRYCEDIVRLRMGYFAIGKKWTTEIHLLNIVRRLYPNYTVIHQYELDHLRADIFIENLNLVIEYQGEAHFKPIKAWGGEESLKKRQFRDKEKIDRCNHYNLGLIYFTYKDDLTEDLVRTRINQYLNGEG